jgi:hypothetical protein
MPLIAQRPDRRLQIALSCVVLGYLVYAAAYIYASSFSFLGTRYFSLFEDMMISMRYARNLADGAGLVWNAGGERIEGFSNPLWVLVMAGAHLLPISELRTSLVIQALGAILLAVNLVFTARVAALASGGARLAVVFAAAMTALYLPLNTWGLLGTEVSLLTLLLTAAMWYSLKSVQEGRTDLPLPADPPGGRDPGPVGYSGRLPGDLEFPHLE